MEKIFKKIERFRKKIIYSIITSSRWKYRKKYAKEIEYLKKKGKIVTFPYDFSDLIYVKKDDIKYDQIHNKTYVLMGDKKLYWWDGNREEDNLDGAIYSANELFLEQHINSPHRYFTESFYPEQDEIFIDIGCAEGKEALEIVDRVKEVYLFESNSMWKECLGLTFEPYKNVHIINATVCSINSPEQNRVRLSDCINSVNEKLLIKLDVEGAELEVLKGMEDILRSQNVRLLVTLYHRKNDVSKLASYLQNLGYQIEFSDNYMLTHMKEKEFFVHGLLRAKKVKGVVDGNR